MKKRVWYRNLHIFTRFLHVFTRFKCPKTSILEFRAPPPGLAQAVDLLPGRGVRLHELRERDERWRPRRASWDLLKQGLSERVPRAFLTGGRWHNCHKLKDHMICI